jgi:hypothetical protein
MIQMKKNLIIAILLFAVVSGFYSCTTKTVNDFNDFVAGLGTGAYMKGKAFFDPNTNQWTDQSNLGNTLDAANLSTARIGVKVRQWGDPISYINIYCVRNTDGNQANWKFIKKINIVDTNYFDIFVTAQEIATALNLQLNANAGNFAPGSIFTCYVEVVTTEGKKFTANNSNFTASGANFFYPVFSFRGSVVCPYNPAVMPGNYVVVQDDWADWNPGDVLNNIVSATTATSLSLLNVFPNPAFGGNSPQPILVNVTVASGVATVTNQTYGNYGSTPVAVTTQGSGNFVYSCTGTITLLLRHHVPGNTGLSYGNYQLTLRKQ